MLRINAPLAKAAGIGIGTRVTVELAHQGFFVSVANEHKLSLAQTLKAINPVKRGAK